MALGVSGACTNKVSAQAIRFPSSLIFAYPTTKKMNTLLTSMSLNTVPHSSAYIFVYILKDPIQFKPQAVMYLFLEV